MGRTSTLLIRSADGSGQAKKLGISGELVEPTGWSPDGRHLAFDWTEFQGRYNWQSKLCIARIEGTGKLEVEIDEAAEGAFSPDGHWLAYSDLTSGEVYVTPFPGPGARIAVSSGGGSEARWRSDGKELFYVSSSRMMVAVQTRESAQEFRVLSSQPLFQPELPWNIGFYDVTADGQRFLLNTRTQKEKTEPLTLVTNWTIQLRSETSKKSPPE